MHPNPNHPDEGPVLPPTPMVYESVEYHWEYKHLQRNLDEQALLEEERLNELGQESWELVTVLKHNNTAHYYFKRTTEES